MKIKDIELRRLTTGIIILGVLISLMAPALELFNIVSHSNKIVITVEILFLTFFLVQALIVKNGERWKHAILISLPVLLADIFARIFSLYQRIEGFGYFGHFWIGIGLSTALVLVYKKRFRFIIFFNLILASAWEIAELAQDRIFKSITPPWLTDTPLDGILDILLTIAGTLIGYFLIKRYYGNKKRK